MEFALHTTSPRAAERAHAELQATSRALDAAQDLAGADDDEEGAFCSACNGSGEGSFCGSVCSVCGGDGGGV